MRGCPDRRGTSFGLETVAVGRQCVECVKLHTSPGIDPLPYSETLLLENARDLLRCPVCRSKLQSDDRELACVNSECRRRYPVIDGIPVLLNDDASVFSIDDFVSHRATTFALRGRSRRSRLKETLVRCLPSISKNVKAKANYARFADLLLQQSPNPRVLVIGGSIVGYGMEVIVDNSSFELVESDVSFGARTALICDAHDIPFEDGAFDGVVVQAVLEHVVDPRRCVDEIHRVLAERGLVYAETPFMQQVHGRQYDFTRFTHLGHRRLFREFEEIDSGVVCGPGMALAWSYQNFLLSFARSGTIRYLIRLFTSLTSFYLKYFDRFLVNRPGALDAASGYYFVGRRTDDVLSDKELVRLYRGAG